MSVKWSNDGLLKLLAATNDRWRQWQGTPPNIVYHYTRAAALPLILESKRVWATVSTELNDKRELEHASDILREVLKARASSRHNQARMYSPYVVDFPYPRSDLLTTFVTSLSGAEDDLAQWCMYGDSFAGVALGFDSTALAARDALERAPQPVGFFKVLYSETEQARFFEWLVETWEGLVATRWQRQDTSEMDTRMRRIVLWSELAIAALGVIPRMKARHFATESEWRIAHLHTRQRNCCEVSASSARPHVALDLAPPGGKMPLVSVWLGPAVANDDSEKLVRRILTEHHREDVSVRRSEIPLRGEERRIAF